MSTNPVIEPSSEATLSRRGFLMKLGILFNALAGLVVAIPIVRYLASSVTPGRTNAYLSWVPLGRIGDFPEGETRLATFRNPYTMPSDGQTVDTACWVRRVEGDQFQVFAINCAHLEVCPIPLVPAIRSFHVSLPRRRVLPRRLTRLRAAGTWAFRVSEQNRGWSDHDSGWRVADTGRTDGESVCGETAVRMIAKVGKWFDQRLQLAAPIREAVGHPIPRSTASWWYVFGSAALTVFLLQSRYRNPAGADLRTAFG